MAPPYRMNTRDLPIGVLGVGILYIAYLLQNNRLRLGLEGFQDAMPPSTPMDPSMPPSMPPSSMPPSSMPPPSMPMDPSMAASSMPMDPSMAASSMMPPPPTTLEPPPPVADMDPADIAAKQIQTLCVGPLDLLSIKSRMALQGMTEAPRMPTAPPPPTPTPPPLVPPPPTEGFQSYGNPYNESSPSNQQAYEFRLGRRTLTNDVLSFMDRF